MKGGLIGFGYWAKILCKNFKRAKNILYVFDISKKAQKQAQKAGFQTVNSLKQLLSSKEIEFLIIATPPSTHYELVREGLKFKKHILVEKPFGSFQKDKSILFQIAKKKKKVLMINYSYIYSPGFQELKKLLANSKMQSYESLRFNFGFPRQDINVVDDLVIHDLSMLLELIPSQPLNCFCQPLENKGSNIYQQALVSITGKTWRAFIYASRVFSEKQRIVLVKSAKKEIEFKEKNGKVYTRFLNSKKNSPLKSKSSLEYVFEEFFGRIKRENFSNDFVRYKKISSLLMALNQSVQKDGETVKIK